ncbi:P-loop containing nucleoside triphosphate hydrolase protein [Endogone sp. FLAS-F59071]|nr:P-loop containing nucleoside triphosphate hydrolase protein [Endogone sp. FLAS-F59071]|eukprot:RUS20856.1 P-loop containing nucleoside triphosphate hydrolase protein [Endogone sp. FLAS-F59071]
MSGASYYNYYQTDPNTLVISVMGAMGRGKSSLLNAIAGETIYPTGRAVEPITTHVDSAIRPWRNPPISRFCHLIDTPGMCDSSVRDKKNVQEMVKYFKSLSYGVSAFILVFNIDDTRYVLERGSGRNMLDAYTQNMLHLFERLLGRDFWRYVIIVFTHVDEDNRDLLGENIDALSDPQGGFVAEIQRVFDLDPVSIRLPIIFLTTKNVKYSTYAHQNLKDLYDAIQVCEEQTRGKKFSCRWFQQILATPNEEQKTGFIVSSLRDAVSAIRNVVSGGGSDGSSRGGMSSGVRQSSRDDRSGWCPIQ